MTDPDSDSPPADAPSRSQATTPEPRRPRWSDVDVPERPPAPIDASGEADAPGEIEGRGLINLSFAGAGALAAGALVGAIDPDPLGVVTAAVSLVAFAVGTGCFLWGYALGVARSREERVTLGGLFFLNGTAPRVVRFRLRIAFGLQVVAAVAAASVRPYTAVAFAVLGPMLGLGLLALWGGRHAVFFPREP